MKENKELFSHAATVFHVTDMQQSLDFYQNALGFEATFTWEDPVSYAVLKRGDISIHLSKAENSSTPKGNSLYVFVHDVDAVYDEFIARGASIENPPKTYEYGMRDFDVIDPDGYQLTFGKGV